AGDDGEGSAAFQRGRDEIVAVARGTGNGEEDVARLEAAGVGQSGCSRARGAVLGCGPPSTAARTTSWSLNGKTSLPTIWPVSWPLPATTSTSPLFRPAMAAKIASARSPISMAPGQAARMAARIAAGLSPRGLS